MPIQAYIARDGAGNPWPPVHEHEATAVIGLIQRLHEAFHHEKTFYGVLANLQAPSADIVVITELGLGVIELKHYSGKLSTSNDQWFADGKYIRAGNHAANPREQSQNYADRLRRLLAPHLSRIWRIDQAEVMQRMKLQTAVCFTNQRAIIDETIRATIERDADRLGRRWSTFRLLTPADVALWVSALRFSVEQDYTKQFAPYRLTDQNIDTLTKTVLKGSEWTEIYNLMPTGTPYGYLTLRQAGQPPQLFPLHRSDVTIGRDGTACDLTIAELFRRTSRKHLRVSRVASHVWVHDLKSTHGTYIDGIRVNEPVTLKVGQHITLGGPQAGAHVCTLVFSDHLPKDVQIEATALNTSLDG